MKISQPVIPFIQSLAQKLSARFENSEQSAWWLLEKLAEKSKEQLILDQEIYLSDEQKQLLDEWIQKIIEKKKPLQYILGSVPFCDLEILVEPPILIPRPETEELCTTLIKQLQSLENQKFSILDLCTGSGCIALALAKAFPGAKIFATDISKKALELAEKNAVHNKIINVTFLRSDVFDQISRSFKFDIIISNPPYIDQQDWQNLDESVRLWEDKNALVAAQHGLAIIEKIIKGAPNYLRENNQMKELDIPQLVLEISHTQGTLVQKLMQQHGFDHVKIEKDLVGKDRFVTGRVDHVAPAEIDE